MKTIKERTYFISVSWRNEGVMEVVANSLEEAEKEIENMDLPDGDFVEDSLIINSYSAEYEDNEVSYSERKYDYNN